MEKMIGQITDEVEDEMGGGNGISWREFWVDVCGYDEPPTKEEVGYFRYVAKRLRIKNEVNKELAERKDARRLRCKHAKGLRLAHEKEVGLIYAEVRIRKALDGLLTSISVFDDFVKADNMPVKDKRMISRLTGNIELHFDAYFGQCLRMRSLPKEAKNRLLGEYQSE